MTEQEARDQLTELGQPVYHVTTAGPFVVPEYDQYQGWTGTYTDAVEAWWAFVRVAGAMRCLGGANTMEFLRRRFDAGNPVFCNGVTITIGYGGK